MSKTIFISGASKGIGLSIAQRFYAEGFRVGISARSAEGLDAARALMPHLHTFQCDMADVRQVKQLAELLNQHFGPLEVLVNNAGIYKPGLVHTEEDAQFELMMATNLSSAYYLTKGVLPLMKQQKRGAIFNMGSIASFMPYGGSYAISKHALLGFSRVLRQELMQHSLRVMTIMPGAVKTASWEGSSIPEQRFMPPEDIAAVVWDAYRLSERTVIEEVTIRPLLGDI